MTTKSKPHGPKLVRIEIRNVQGCKIAVVEHIPDRGLIPITGKGGSGKTSFLRAINGGVGGDSRVHERAVNDESEDGTGHTYLTLGEGWEVRRHSTPSNPKGALYVKAPDGGKHGQAKLNELMHNVDPDVQSFFGLTVARMTEILLGIGKDPELPKKLAGKKALWQKTFAERTPEISAQMKARGVKRPQGERPEAVDTSAEMARLQGLQAVERRRADLVHGTERAREAAARKARDAQGDAEAAADQADQRSALATHAAHAAAEEVKEIQDALAAARARAESAITAAMAAQKAASEAHAVVGHLPPAEEIPDPELPPDPAPEIEAVQDRISRAETVQRSIRPWELYEEAQAELARATAEVARKTKAMDAIEAERVALVEAAEIPVPGLSFDSDGIPLYKARPLELASGSERVRMAFDVAKAVRLGFTLIDEGDVLDDDMLADIDRESRGEPGIQVFIASVGRTGPGFVQMVNGEARTREAEPELGL